MFTGSSRQTNLTIRRTWSRYKVRRKQVQSQSKGNSQSFFNPFLIFVLQNNYVNEYIINIDSNKKRSLHCSTTGEGELPENPGSSEQSPQLTVPHEDILEQWSREMRRPCYRSWKDASCQGARFTQTTGGRIEDLAACLMFVDIESSYMPTISSTHALARTRKKWNLVGAH